MPRLSKTNPKYRKHRASGQAIVTIHGVDHYLGPHGTEASRNEYDRLIAEYLANDRRPPARNVSNITVMQVLIRYPASLPSTLTSSSSRDICSCSLIEDGTA